jgi:hypothetical protein
MPEQIGVSECRGMIGKRVDQHLGGLAITDGSEIRPYLDHLTSMIFFFAPLAPFCGHYLFRPCDVSINFSPASVTAAVAMRATGSHPEP